MGIMTTVRVKIECDIEVTDEAAADEVFREFAVDSVDDRVVKGHTIDSGDGTPHDVIENLKGTHMVHVALVLEALKRGARSMPMNYTVAEAHAPKQ